MTRSTASALPLPLHIRDIEAGWLGVALGAQYPGLIVTHAETVAVLFGTSTKVRVRIECEGPGREALGPTLIVKGGFEDHSPGLAAMYANEARFYADIAPLIPMVTPLCHFAGSDPGSYQSIVILEDLKRPGLDFCNPLVPQSFEQIARRLDGMAAYHAATWETEHFQPGGRWSDIASRFDTWGLDYMKTYLQPKIWDHYMALPRAGAVPERFRDRVWMETALRRLGEIQAEQPHCLIHGDTHLGNLYIAEDGTPGFFDAQVARTAWHHEIAYHIVCALTPEDRARWERELLEYYLGQLETHGGPRLDREDAWLDYRRSIVWGLFIFMINEVRFQTEQVNTAYTARFGAAAAQYELEKLLP